MANKTKSGLPSGVSVVANRPGLYRLTCMINGKRYSEYYRPTETSKKKLQSDLQKAVDAFREKAERGALKGQITDKSKISEAVEWYLNTSRLELRESTHNVTEGLFNAYILHVLGRYPLREITSPMITQLLANLLEKGGGRVTYVVRSEFMEDIRGQITVGKVNDTAADIGIGTNTFLRVRSGQTVDETTAAKTAEYFKSSIDKAFERRETSSSLKATFVNRISTCLSALFTALVKNDILVKTPVLNATKPRVGEMKRGAYLDNITLPLFLAALDGLEDSSVRIALTLCLQLGLRSGEARALHWTDINLSQGIVSVNYSVGETSKGLVIGEPKTKRSIRKLPLSPFLYDSLLDYRMEQSSVERMLGSVWTNNGLVCPNTTGGIMDKGILQRTVKNIVKANPALPPDLHPHSLRHSFVSLLIAKGLDVVNVAALAGDTVEVISKIYAHSFAEKRAAAMDMIGTAFEQALPVKDAPPMLSVMNG